MTPDVIYIDEAVNFNDRATIWINNNRERIQQRQGDYVRDYVEQIQSESYSKALEEFRVAAWYGPDVMDEWLKQDKKDITTQEEMNLYIF